MPSQPRRNDIPIGESRWIEFIELEGRYGEAISIDSLLVDIFPLLDVLEKNCVAECCGFNAFDFYPETICSVVFGMDDDVLINALGRAIVDVGRVETSVVVSSRMNNFADKRVFVALLRHIKSCIEKSR
jgi:hypothetical protein